MAVGITILSGTRKDIELGIDRPEFRAGDDPACEVFFDPEEDPGARGAQALFRLGDDGWYVKNTGGRPVLVNNRAIEARTRLRSGDVVRMSPEGPEFAFKLLAQLPAGAAKEAMPPHEADNDAPATPFLLNWRFLVALLAGSAIGLVLFYVIVRQPAPSVEPRTVSSTQGQGDLRQADAADETRSGDAVTSSPDNAVTTQSADDVTSREAGAATSADAEGSGVAPPAPAPKDVPDDAVLLLLVEEPKSASAWPFGSAAAIADRTLLTSATVATGLAGFREKGWRLWATNQRLGLKVEVADLRVHAAFAASQGQPEKQVYVDLGLLTVADSLPKRLGLATADELADLDRGTPVTLLGYLYENEPVDRFQTFLAEPQVGKVFVITSLPPSPGGPRLMHVRAELSGKMYGAPVLNSAGHVVGVFAETASPSPEQQGADLQIHYAPVIDPQQMDRWTTDHDEQWWVVPASPKSQVQSPKS